MMKITIKNDSDENENWMKTLPGYQNEAALTRRVLKKRKIRFKGGSGSGHYGHRGRPGLVGGGLPDNAAAPAYGITKGSKLEQDIANGVYDIPANIKKRRFQMQNSHPEAEAYAERVWAGLTEEMKAQGISDEDIKSVEFALYRFLGSTDSMEAKVVIGALEKSLGKSDDEVRKIITDEYYSRLSEKGVAQIEFGYYLMRGGDPFSDEGLTMFSKMEPYLSEPNFDDMRNPQYWYRNSIIDRAKNAKDYAVALEQAISTAQDDGVAQAISIVSDASKRLYARNAESETLYRGIYDFQQIRGRGSRAHTVESPDDYAPVKWIRDQFYRYETDPEHTWRDIRVEVGTTASIDCDRLVCWAPSKQIARTFAAGGGLRGDNIARKAILSSTTVDDNVAFYWPAIYNNLGSSIDTKEVWVYYPDGKLSIDIGGFEEV